MAVIKALELREMSDEQLVLTLKDTSENLFRLRMQAQTERLDAPSELKKSRRTIARIKTILREREIENCLIVTARFFDKKDSKPITGPEYRVKVFDKDIFIDDPMGEGVLNGAGMMRIVCDLRDATKNDGFLKFLEGRPDLYVVLVKQVTVKKKLVEKELFRSHPAQAPKRGLEREFDLGVFKV